MEYSALVAVYADLESTAGTLEKQSILAECLAAVDETHLPMVVKLVRGTVFSPWESGELGVSSALAMDAIATATGIDHDQLEDWWREEGDLGSAAGTAVAERTQQPLVREPLTVERVHDTLRELATYEGEGSQGRKVDAVAGLLSDASPQEATYLVRTVTGAMRLGVGEGIVRDAIAAAFLADTEPAADAVQRALDVTNDFALVAERARDGGRAALDELDVEVFRPIKPMLAHTADDLESVLADLGNEDGVVLLETKYDGIRAKLHRQDDAIRLFTRRLEEVTEQFPDVVESVEAGIDAREFIVEAEVVGIDPDTGDPVPFQELSRRIKRKYDIEAMADEVPVRVYAFDLLYLEGESYLETPLATRLAELSAVLDPTGERLRRAEHVRTDALEPARKFYRSAIDAGHEGVMAKNLEATYQPGSRVGYQRKVKATMESLDLVVTRAKWSEGRKSDFLGRPYLACRAADGSFKEVGRMHTGFTDAQLAEFTELVTPLIQAVEGREATLEPAVVLTVEYEEIQESPKYDSGYALRFPRLKRIRHDLDPADADTLERVETLYERQY